MDDPGAIRWDAAAKLVVLGERRTPLSVDCATGDVTVEVGGAEFRLRPLRWREKRTLSRFAHLGPEWVAEQRVRAAVTDPASVPEGVAGMLAALARWLDETGAGVGAPGLPLDPTLLATVSRDVCRSLEVGPLDLDGLPAADVEAAWAANPRRDEAEPQQASPATDEWDTGPVNRIVLLAAAPTEEPGPFPDTPATESGPRREEVVASPRRGPLIAAPATMSDPSTEAVVARAAPPAATEWLPPRTVRSRDTDTADQMTVPSRPTADPAAVAPPSTGLVGGGRPPLASPGSVRFTPRGASTPPAKPEPTGRPAVAPPGVTPAAVASATAPPPAPFAATRAPTSAGPAALYPAHVGAPAAVANVGRQLDGAAAISAAFRSPAGSVAAGGTEGGADTALPIDDVCDELAVRIEEAALQMGLGGVAG